MRLARKYQVVFETMVEMTVLIEVMPAPTIVDDDGNLGLVSSDATSGN